MASPVYEGSTPISEYNIHQEVSQSDSFLSSYVEINKPIKILNPEFMNNIFKVKENKRYAREQCKLDLEFPEWTRLLLGQEL